ncbi:MAG: hypothetical protein U0R49_10000 [Fimbriimonadales bacterium]
MTNLQLSPRLLFTSLTVVSLIAIVGASYAILRPLPSATEQIQKLRAQELKLREETDNLKKRAVLAGAKVNQYLSVGTPDEIETQATNRINEVAKAHGLRVVAVRPQKAGLVGPLFEQPLIVAVEGRFTGVVGFAAELGTPTSKLAVTQLQVTSADAGSDLVNATLGLLALSEPSLSGDKKK